MTWSKITIWGRILTHKMLYSRMMMKERVSEDERNEVDKV